MNRRGFLTTLGAAAATLLTQRVAAQGFWHGPAPQQPDQRSFDVIDQANRTGFRVYPGVIGPWPQPTIIVGRDETRRPIVWSGNDRDPRVCAYVGSIFKQYATNKVTISSPTPDNRGSFIAVFGGFNVKADNLGQDRSVALVTHPDHFTRIDSDRSTMYISSIFNDKNNRQIVAFGIRLTIGEVYNFSTMVNTLAHSTKDMPNLQGIPKDMRGYLAETVLVAMLNDRRQAKDELEGIQVFDPPHLRNRYAYVDTIGVGAPPDAPRYPLEMWFGGKAASQPYDVPNGRVPSYGAPTRPAENFGAPTIPSYGQ